MITVREPRKLLPVAQSNQTASMSISLSPKRKIFWGERPPSSRRVRSYMKQVVGSLFCGLDNGKHEDAIIKKLVKFSEDCLYDSNQRASDRKRKTETATRLIVAMLKPLIARRLGVYLHSIIVKLFDRKNHLSMTLHISSWFNIQVSNL